MRRIKSWTMVAIISVAVFGFALYDYDIWLQRTDRVCSMVLYPFIQLHGWATQTVGDWRTLQNQVCQLQQQLKQLEQERAQLLQELVAVNAVYHYDASIAELRTFRERYSWQYGHIVQILMTHCCPDEQYMLVEGGTQAGITDGMIALIDNHLIGRVVQVFPYYAKVLLITDRRVNIAAYCTQTGATGIFSGDNSKSNAKLYFVDHLQQLKVGDMVLSSGQGLVYPQGLCLGSIVGFTRRGIEYEVTVTPRVDLQRLTYCLLIERRRVTMNA